MSSPEPKKMKEEEEGGGKGAETSPGAPTGQPEAKEGAEGGPPSQAEGQQPASHGEGHPAPAHGQPPPPGAYPPPPPPHGYYYPPPPPPGQEGQPYPPRGYEGQPPPHYMPPPHGHGPPHHGPGMPPPYPMYPPYQHMYPPPHYYPGHPPPYGYPDPNRDGHGSPGSYPAPASGEGEEGKDGDIVPGAVTARLKTYIKPRIPSTQEVLDRRSRKNAQSRARAAKLRDRIAEIESKPENERTEEERQIYGQYEARRQRKNDRSRERALEKKEEIDRILAKPEKKRTKIEKQFLETALSAKKRKNEGDRLRRQRLKELGLSSKGTGVKPGISARGPLPPQYQQQAAPRGYGEMPMSPLPTMHHHHHQMQSPGGYGSPGMMPNISFPSPQGQQTKKEKDEEGANNRVEQRRNPDGSMSISIGAGGNQEGQDISDVSHLLMNEDYDADVKSEENKAD